MFNGENPYESPYIPIKSPLNSNFLHKNMLKQVPCKPHVCPHRIPHISFDMLKSLCRARVFLLSKNLKPKSIKNPKTLKT